MPRQHPHLYQRSCRTTAAVDRGRCHHSLHPCNRNLSVPSLAKHATQACTERLELRLQQWPTPYDVATFLGAVSIQKASPGILQTKHATDHPS